MVQTVMERVRDAGQTELSPFLEPNWVKMFSPILRQEEREEGVSLAPIFHLHKIPRKGGPKSNPLE